jgi:hypothetical protein
MNLSWTASEGYLHYGKTTGFTPLPVTEDDAKIPVNGSVISYTQNWVYVPIGLLVTLLPGSMLSGTVYFYAGPILAYSGQDEHYQKINSGYFSKFYDRQRGGYVIQPGGQITVTLGKYSLMLFCSWNNFVPAAHGDSAARTTGYPGVDSWQSLGRLAGAGLSIIDTGIKLPVMW